MFGSNLRKMREPGYARAIPPVFPSAGADLV
jgi:hypothetical protein